MTEQTLILKAESTYVGLWPRVGALLLDGLITAPLSVLSILSVRLGQVPGTIAAIAVSAAGVLYFVVFTALLGATPGKLAIRARIRTTDGARIGWEQAWMREAVSIFFALAFVADRLWILHAGHSLHYWNGLTDFFSISWLLADVITLVTDERKRSLHDRIAGTVVMRKWSAEQARPHGQP